jgi:hypothetical protein
VGSEMQRKRISLPSVVGRTMSARCKVDNSESAFMGVNGCASVTPLVEGAGTASAQLCSGASADPKCVTQEVERQRIDHETGLVRARSSQS